MAHVTLQRNALRTLPGTVGRLRCDRLYATVAAILPYISPKNTTTTVITSMYNKYSITVALRRWHVMTVCNQVTGQISL